MILNALRHFRSLSGYHYRMVVLTILLPAIGPTSLALFGPDHFILRIILYVSAFLVWSVLAVASMLKRDKSETEQLTSPKLEALSARIGRLREEPEDSRVDLQQQVNDLEEVVRSTLREELGGVLPPRPVSVRPKPVRFGFDVSAANVTVTRGSKVAHLRLWLRRAMRLLCEVVYGKPEDS